MLLCGLNSVDLHASDPVRFHSERAQEFSFARRPNVKSAPSSEIPGMHQG